MTDCGADYNPFTTSDNDCNDANPAVYPGNTETCDAIDNDCDGFINEGAVCVGSSNFCLDPTVSIVQMYCYPLIGLFFSYG